MATAHSFTKEAYQQEVSNELPKVRLQCWKSLHVLDGLGTCLKDSGHFVTHHLGALTEQNEVKKFDPGTLECVFLWPGSRCCYKR